MQSNTTFQVLALDIGERRTGMAIGDTKVKIPRQIEVLETAELTSDYLKKILDERDISVLVIGLPRNQNGEQTAQTKWVQDFVASLGLVNIPIVFQDESLTSVMAETRLKSYKKPYSKADIDSMAACIILEDYLESH